MELLSIAKKYVIKEKIGKGKFGEVYKGMNEKTREFVAMKLEDSKTRTKLLKHETTLLKYLYDHDCRNIPTVYWYGIWNTYSCLIMPFYECSLYDKLRGRSDKSNMSLNADLVMVACIEIIESIHKTFVIHRDIKPQNFMLQSGELHIIDFGLSTFYIGENKEHVPMSASNEHIIGTPKYVSPNIHNGITPSRRDDMISLGYMYLWMICGELHWDNIIDDGYYKDIADEGNILHNKNQQRKILKEWSFIEPICAKINQNIYRYLNYLYELRYEETPNYAAVKQLFSLNNYST